MTVTYQTTALATPPDATAVATDNVGGAEYQLMKVANTGIGDGRKVVATAGTREALATTTACNRVIITAETDNTGLVVVGGATVVAALATRRGVPLSAGDSIELTINDLASVFLDVTVSGDGVSYLYLT